MFMLMIHNHVKIKCGDDLLNYLSKTVNLSPDAQGPFNLKNE